MVAVGTESLELVGIFSTWLLVTAVLILSIFIITTLALVLTDVSLIIDRGARKPSLLQLRKRSLRNNVTGTRLAELLIHP